MNLTKFSLLRLSNSPALRLATSRLARWFLTATVLATAVPLLAYGPSTARRVTEVSLRLAPPSLRAVLLANRAHLDQGVSDALQGYASASVTEVAGEAQREFSGLPGLPGAQTPLEVVAYHFGRLAGLLYTLNDPFTRGDDPRAQEVRQDYMAYVERKLSLMVFSFDGYDAPPLEGDLRAYVDRRVAAEGRYREAVLFCYFPKGERVSSDTFDDRSNAFGVAQVMLSHAASDAAKAWLQVWQAMDGDLSATPYYRPEELGRATGTRAAAQVAAEPAGP